MRVPTHKKNLVTLWNRDEWLKIKKMAKTTRKTTTTKSATKTDDYDKDYNDTDNLNDKEENTYI